MKDTKKNANNNVHLYGYVNGVRTNEVGEGENKRYAINLDVATLETFKNSEGNFVNNRSYHDVVIFTKDKELADKFEKLGADKENHTVSVSGVLVDRSNTIKGTEVNYRSLQVMADEKSLDIDAKQGEKEIRNRAEIVGNIASIKMYPEKEFATVSLIHHYTPKEGDAKYETHVDLRVSGNRKYSKPMYEALRDGKMEVGDFVRVGGQIHNNNFEVEAGKKYGTVIDVTSSELLHKKGEKVAESVEVKEEKAPKKAPAKAAAEKTDKKPEKAVSRRRNKGVNM